MEAIKAGAKSRGALFHALGSNVETIHSLRSDYSETLKVIAEKLVEKDRERSIQMLVDGYAEIDGVKTTSITQVWYGIYEKSFDFSDGLNNGQMTAYEKAINTDEDLFIDGMGGTGKSTVLARIAQKLGLRCCVLAPTNAAVKRIAEELPDEHGLILSTIHRALRYSASDVKDDPDGVEDALELSFMRNTHDRSILTEIVIIDEAGMVNSEFIEEIKKECRRVIFFGDLCQLEPVEGEQYNFENVEQIELTQQMRQNFTDTALYRSIMSFRTMIKDNRLDRGKMHYDGKTVIEVDSLARHFIDKMDIDVIGSFTNDVVIQTNEFIKDKLSGTKEIVVGDKLLLYAPVINDAYDNVSSNGEIVEVKSSYFNGYLGRTQYRFHGVHCEDRMIFNTSKDCYSYWEDKMKHNPSKKIGWRTFKKASVIARPVYCRTVHKLQGSTFNTIGVNHHDISGKTFDIDTYNRLMYVALSRAKSRVYIMN